MSWRQAGLGLLMLLVDGGDVGSRQSATRRHVVGSVAAVVMPMFGKTEEFPVRCPHCGQDNELASSFDGKSTLADALRKGHIPLMICSRCTGVWLYDHGVNRAITPEEWLEFTAEERGAVQQSIKFLQSLQKLRKP